MGTILMPVTEVMTLGRMCIAADPTGAVFGVWQPEDFPGAGIVNEHGALIWNELNTTDCPAATTFYRAAFGMESTAMDGAESYYALNVDDRPVGGMQPMSAQMPPDTPSHWLVYFSVADTDETVGKVTAAAWGGAAAALRHGGLPDGRGDRSAGRHLRRDQPEADEPGLTPLVRRSPDTGDSRSAARPAGSGGAPTTAAPRSRLSGCAVRYG